MIYLELFFTFLKIGAFTFGGGYAMLPLIIDAVISNGWMKALQNSTQMQPGSCRERRWNGCAAPTSRNWKRRRMHSENCTTCS